jgi:MFS family permease
MALAPGTRGYTKAIVTAQMLAQIGAFALPALLPDYIARWNLSKTEAGWLVGIFFAAYVVMVPVLVALTDRVPVRRVYVLGTSLTALSHFGFALFADGFWSALLLRLLAGIGWAGTYMPGLKAIADPLEGIAQSRAVSWHAAGVGISGAASFTIAGLVAGWAGPSAPFLLGGGTALSAVLITAMVMPSALAAPATKALSRKLLDFRPVLRNRAAMGWIVGYTVHTWELSALRAWGPAKWPGDAGVTAIVCSLPRWEAVSRNSLCRNGQVVEAHGEDRMDCCGATATKAIGALSVVALNCRGLCEYRSAVLARPNRFG